MKRIALLTFAILTAAFSPAMGKPTAYYTPATGHVRLVNDLSGLGFFFLASNSGAFATDLQEYATIPGGQLDPTALPDGFAYLHPPNGSFEIGNIVASNTPTTDLFLRNYVSNFEFTGDVVQVPELASVSLAAITLMGLAATRRRLLFR